MTLPPSFRVEMENKEKELSYRRREVAMIRESLQEKYHNPVCVGLGGQKIVKRAIQPHNYRLYFRFDRTSFNPTQEGFVSKNHNSEYHSKTLIKGCQIIIKKKLAEVINKKRQGYFFRLYGHSLKDIDKRLDEIRAMMDYECIEALHELIRQYGGASDFEIQKRNLNDMKVLGDSYLDNMPKNLIIDDYPYFKKVYAEKTEIYGFEHTRNYLRNRMIEDISPQIAEEISELRKENDLLKWLKSQINGIDDVFLNKQDILKLSEKEKAELSLFLFELYSRSHYAVRVIERETKKVGMG